MTLGLFLVQCYRCKKMTYHGMPCMWCGTRPHPDISASYCTHT